MKKFDKVLKKLSELYEFNRKIRIYGLKKRADKPLKADVVKDRGVRPGTRKENA